MAQPERPIVRTATNSITRRELLRNASAAAVLGGLGKLSLAQAAPAAPSAAVDKTRAFPDKFLWGCATAAHQVEGNNVNSDYWAMEHLPQSIFKEPSGDACDHYHLYPPDTA
jgi:beta-glucosidase